MQITKAMELVATSKLRRAKAKVESSRPFHEILKEAIDDIRALPELRASVWSKPNTSDKTLMIVIAGDRGLAGGYNSNVFRLADSTEPIEKQTVLAIGKKACEYYRYRTREQQIRRRATATGLERRRILRPDTATRRLLVDKL